MICVESESMCMVDMEACVIGTNFIYDLLML